MKTFALILTALALAILLASCGLIYTTSADKETAKLADEYGGVYVFDKKFRDEIIQREKEREDYRKNRYNQMEEEKLKIVLTEFTEEERQEYKNLKDRIEKRKYVSDNEPILIKVNKINSNLWDKYPDLMEEKFPQTLSNGCEYVIDKYKQYYFEDIYHYPKFKKYVVEYMGEEIYEKLKGYLVVTSYYIDEEKHIVPITIEVDIPEVVTTYGLYGDEGRGFRLTQSYLRGISGNNIFYLENGRFIKSDEKRFGETK